MNVTVSIDITPDSANNLVAALLKAVGTGGATTPAAEAPAKPAGKKIEKPAAPAVTLDDLKAAATNCVATPAKKAKLVALNKDTFGVSKISELKPEQFADALKAYKALAAEAEEEDPTA